MRILGIDTSGKVASVALTDGGRLICEKVLYTKLTHSQIILPMVKEVLADSSMAFSDIDCIAVANGPGSYTGLRIGIAAVKGICLGAPDIKCAGISTLEALAYNCSGFCGRIISVMKARPEIVYAGEFESDGSGIKRVSEDRVCPEIEVFGGLDPAEKIMLVGDYAEEIKEKYFKDNANVLCASIAQRLQRASSLCMALAANEGYIVEPESIEVSYLQATKAEKDKNHRD